MFNLEKRKRCAAAVSAFIIAVCALLTTAIALTDSVSAYGLGNKLYGDPHTLSLRAADSVTPAIARAERVSVCCNGKYLYRSLPLLINANTYLPAEEFFAAIGCDVGQITISNNGYTVEANGRAVFCPSAAFALPDSVAVSLNGEFGPGSSDREANSALPQSVTPSFSAASDSGYTLYIPARAAAQLAECEIVWDGTTSTAYFNGGRGYVADGVDVYYPSDIYWLSRIVEAESGCEPFLGKLAVANVVLNRIASKEFPNDMYSVIFDRKFGVQFTPTANGTIYNTPSDASVAAAKAALEGYSLTADAIYFIAPSIAQNFWVPNNRPHLFGIGSHEFYR